MSAKEMSKRGIIAKGDIVYRVFLQLTFTKRASSIIDGGRLVKQFTVEVPVHYDGKRYFINYRKIKSVPVKKEFW